MFLSACLLAALPGADPAPESVAVSVTPAGGGKLLFVAMHLKAPRGAGTSWVCVWDTSKPELKAVISEIPADVRTIHPTTDGKQFVLIGGDGRNVSRIEVWDVAEKKRLRDFAVPKIDGSAVVSPDGNWVVFHSQARAADLTFRVWNTQTGKRATELETAVGNGFESAAFTADSKRLAVASRTDYREFDVATGKKVKEWTRAEPAKSKFPEGTFGMSVAALPNGKGMVTIANTGKRRQSCVVRLITQKNETYLGLFWDNVSAPVVSSDERWLIISGGTQTESKTFILKLDADGNPEMVDKPEKLAPPGGGDGTKVPAWRALPSPGKADPPIAVLAFSADGKRVFTTGTGGTVQVFDTESLKLKATLLAAEPDKGAPVKWLIHTPDGAYVGSPDREKIYAKGADHARDPARVREALGMK